MCMCVCMCLYMSIVFFYIFFNLFAHIYSLCSFQKTESAVKGVAEKTSSLFSGITGGFTSKISQMKNSESFKSFEERVGSAYENVKVRLKLLNKFLFHFHKLSKDKGLDIPIWINYQFQ